MENLSLTIKMEQLLSLLGGGEGIGSAKIHAEMNSGKDAKIFPRFHELWWMRSAILRLDSFSVKGSCTHILILLLCLTNHKGKI